MNQRSPELNSWLAANGAFLAAAFASLTLRLNWLSLIVSAVVWMLLLVYGILYFSGSRGRSNPAPQWLCRAVDTTALLALLLAESYVTSVAYLASMLLLAQMYAPPLSPYQPREIQSEGKSIIRAVVSSGPWYLALYRLLLLAGMFVLMSIPLLMILALPGWLLYQLILPLTQTDPIAHYEQIALSVSQFALVVAAIVGSIWAVSSLATKVPLVGTALRFAGYAVIALLLVGAVVRCAENPWSVRCTPSRYINC